MHNRISTQQAVSVDQQNLLRAITSSEGPEVLSISNEVKSSDTLNWAANGVLLGPTGATAAQNVLVKVDGKTCWNRTITASDLKLTSVTGGLQCPNEH